jgi:hypothetical protein
MPLFGSRFLRSDLGADWGSSAGIETPVTVGEARRQREETGSKFGRGGEAGEGWGRKVIRSEGDGRKRGRRKEKVL